MELSFFPSEIAFFLIGSLTYFLHIEKNLIFKWKWIKFIGFILIPCFLLAGYMMGMTNGFGYKYERGLIIFYLILLIAFSITVKEKKLPLKSSYLYIIVLLLIFFYSFPIILDGFNRKTLYIIILSLSIGPIFELTKKSSIDNFLGKLSYPVYICHVIILDFIWPLAPYHERGTISGTLTAYVMTLILSMILLFSIEKPIDSIRSSFMKS